MSDQLSIYLQELYAQREADRQPMDEHLTRLLMRDFKYQRENKTAKT